jgi:RNA polymerase sigma-70 factor (ECF subfamily)
MASDSMPTGAATPTATTPPVAEAVVRDHVPVVRRYLRMHGVGSHAADDLTQEAFVIALQKGVLALPGAAVATFLRRTARFLVLRHRRDVHHAVELADAVDELWERQCAGDGGEALLAALRHCIAALPERARLAVVRSYGLGADAPAAREAAAAALGLQQNGLKTLLQRARQSLRACIDKRHP